MILSNISNSQTSQANNFESVKSYVQNLSNLLKTLNKLKSNKLVSKVLKVKMTNSLHSKFVHAKNANSINFNLEKKNLIHYIININLSPTNTLVNVSCVNGNPKMSFSAGFVDLTKRQKKIQPMALIKIFKVLLIKTKFLKNKPVALHFKNTKTFFESLIIKALKDKLFIKSVLSYNLSPHNGCRPKKIRRVKRRTKRMVLR